MKNELMEKISGDILATTAVKLLLQFREALLIPLIAGPLGTESYGVYVQFFVISTTLSTVFGGGLHSSLIHEAQSTTNSLERAKVYWTLFFPSVLMGLCGSLLMFFGAEYLSRYVLSTPKFTSVFKTGSIIPFLLIILRITKNFYRSRMEIRYFSVIDGLQKYTSLGAIAFAIFVLDFRINGIIIALAITYTAYIIILNYIILGAIGFVAPSAEHLPEMFRYSLPFMLSTLSSQSLTEADRLVIGAFLGPSAVGIYTAAYRLASGIRLFMKGITTTFFAEFNRLWKAGKKTEIKILFNNGVRYFTLLAAPSIAGLFLVGPALLKLLLQTTVTPDAVFLIPLIASGVVMYGLANIYSQIFYAAGKTDSVAIVTIACSSTNILLNLFLVNQIGLLGAAVSTLLSYFLMFAAFKVWARNVLTVSFDIVFTMKSALSSVAMVIWLLAIPFESIVLTILFGVVSYFVLLYLFGGFTESETSKILKILGKIGPMAK